ncbi:MAG: DUF6531 domain-containing protein [bacterium]
MRRRTVITIQLIAWSAMTFHVAPASAWTFPEAAVAGRPGMGESKFDANQTEKYTVNVTSGNLYVKQQDFTIPSSRGPSIEVRRTYNSDNIDCPRLFGKGNWSFSLSKSLDVHAFVRCTGAGDMEGIEEGDFLEEEPTYTKPECCDESWPTDCCEETWPADCCEEDGWPPDCCEGDSTLVAFCDCCASYEDCENQCSDQSDWDGCFDYCVEQDYDECADGDIFDFCYDGGASECSATCDCVIDDPNWDCADCDYTCWCMDETDDDGELLCDSCNTWSCACLDWEATDVDGNSEILCDDACQWPGACGDNHDEVCDFVVGQYEDAEGYITTTATAIRC